MAPHPQRLTVTRRGWALARPLTTAHGVKTTADVVIAEISDDDRRGLRIMVGGTIGTSLAIAPALLVAQQTEIVDLGGPLLLAADRFPGLRYDGSTIHPPDPNFWG